jgi:glycosyltransferase involved in cell wall biosynthesis
MFKRKQSKIFLIKYNIETKPVRRKIHRIIKNKVSCVFTSLPQVGEFYEFPYLLIPDYFPVEQYRNLVNHTTKFDFVILGTIDNDKNIEDVIQSILNTEYTLKIAGHFHDKAYLAKIITMSGRSENILIQDKYLSDSEYKDTILQSKYVLLPYKKSAYLIRSSGVILDAVYKGVPVIATDIESFQFISKFGIGYLYDNSFLEILLHINEISYNKLIDNISNFRKMQENKKNELINKIHNLNS